MKNLGTSRYKLSSILFLIIVLLISLALSNVPMLIMNRPTSMPILTEGLSDIGPFIDTRDNTMIQHKDDLNKKYMTETTDSLNRIEAELRIIESGVRSIENVKYIQLGFGDDYISIAQLVGMDVKGNNVTKHQSVTGDSGWNSPPKNAVNGDETAHSFKQGIYHSKAKASVPGNTFEVKLENPVAISKVIIYNCTDCCPERMAKHLVKFLDKDRHLLWTSPQLNGSQTQTVSV